MWIAYKLRRTGMKSKRVQVKKYECDELLIKSYLTS